MRGEAGTAGPVGMWARLWTQCSRLWLRGALRAAERAHGQIWCHKERALPSMGEMTAQNKTRGAETFRAWADKELPAKTEEAQESG